MEARTITLIPGDGIGPEVTAAMQRVIAATGLPITWDIQDIGQKALDKYGVLLPVQTLDSIRTNKVAIKGPTATPIGEGHVSANVKLRRELGLTVNMRPIISQPRVQALYDNVNLMIFRENTEDLYIGEERWLKTEPEFMAAEAVSRITARASRELFEEAFNWTMSHVASYHRRVKVTLVHKANILKMTHGILLDVGRAVAKRYPMVDYEERIADSCMMQLVMNPHQFDVLVAPNFLGDLLSDLAAGLIGGLGFAPGANIGKDYAVFEAVHGTAPDIAGQGKANPAAMILSAAMMLDHLGQVTAASKIRGAVSVAVGTHPTGDVKQKDGHRKPVSTMEFAEAVANYYPHML